MIETVNHQKQKTNILFLYTLSFQSQLNLHVLEMLLELQESIRLCLQQADAVYNLLITNNFWNRYKSVIIAQQGARQKPEKNATKKMLPVSI